MSAWLFGKLPAHGDFVARGLAAGERAELDAWLSASLHAARLDEGFDEAYGRAPPWRGAWDADGRWTAAVVTASVDAVGRRFPILLGRNDVMPQAVSAMTEALEALVYRALGESWDADGLAEAAGHAEGAAADAAPREGWWTVGADGGIAVTLSGARPAELMTAMVKVGQEIA